MAVSECSSADWRVIQIVQDEFRVQGGASSVHAGTLDNIEGAERLACAGDMFPPMVREHEYTSISQRQISTRSEYPGAIYDQLYKSTSTEGSLTLVGYIVTDWPTPELYRSDRKKMEHVATCKETLEHMRGQGGSAQLQRAANALDKAQRDVDYYEETVGTGNLQKGERKGQ
jgi:hypothetical protein